MRSRRCLLGRARKDLIVGGETIEAEKRDQHEGEPAGTGEYGYESECWSSISFLSIGLNRRAVDAKRGDRSLVAA